MRPIRINDKVRQVKNYELREGIVSYRGSIGVVVSKTDDGLLEVIMDNSMFLTLPDYYFSLAG